MRYKPSSSDPAGDGAGTRRRGRRELDPGYEPITDNEPAAVEPRYRMEPVEARDVSAIEERRSGTERRLAELQVEEERRTAERRVAQMESRRKRRHVAARAMQVVDFAFYVLYGLLTIRFVLTLLGASPAAGFVQFINRLTQPFYAPFSGIVGRPSIDGGAVDFPLIIALLAYGLLHLVIRGVVRIIFSDRATV